MIGSDSMEVKVGYTVSGRMFDNALKRCIKSFRKCIFLSDQQDVPTLFNAINAPLLYMGLTQEVLNAYRCWNDATARKRLVHEIARADKALSILRPTAHKWDDIVMPPEYDCREVLENQENGRFWEL
jgi:hypothetical protein